MQRLSPDQLGLAAGHESAAIAAERDGWPVGRIPALRARLVELRRIAVSPVAEPPRLDDATDTAKLEKMLRDHARRVLEDRELAEVSAALAEYTLLELAGRVRELAPDWCAAMARGFDEALAEFRTAAADAPAAISGSSTPDDVMSFQSALRAAEQLDAAFQARLFLAQALSERGAGDGYLAVCEVPLAADPEHPTNARRIEALRDVLAESRAVTWHTRSGTDRWGLLNRATTLRLAKWGELEQRSDMWPTISQSVGGILLSGDREHQARADRLAAVG